MAVSPRKSALFGEVGGGVFARLSPSRHGFSGGARREPGAPRAVRRPPDLALRPGCGLSGASSRGVNAFTECHEEPLKACQGLLPIHFAQVLSYLKASERSLALLINFNVRLLRQGVRRVIRSR